MNSTFTAFLTFSEGGRLCQNEHYRHDKSRIYAVMLAAALDCTCAPVIKWPLSVYPVSHTKSLLYCHKKKIIILLSYSKPQSLISAPQSHPHCQRRQSDCWDRLRKFFGSPFAESRTFIDLYDSTTAHAYVCLAIQEIMSSIVYMRSSVIAII